MEVHNCSLGTECFGKVSKLAEERSTGHCEEEMQEDIPLLYKKLCACLIRQDLVSICEEDENRDFCGGDQSERKHVESDGRRLVSGYTWMDEDEAKHASNTKTLQREEEANVITLAGLKIFPKIVEQGGETIVGDLEVHANGFYYAASGPNFCFSFLYTDVKTDLFRVGEREDASSLALPFS